MIYVKVIPARAAKELGMKTGVQMYIPQGGPWVRPWLKSLGIKSPQWVFDGGVHIWELPYSRAGAILNAAQKIDDVTLVRLVCRHSRCDKRCVEAVNPIWACVCACGGENHGGDAKSWERVGETALAQEGWFERTYLLEKNR
ncbi:hypothetical protein [Zhihengliuella halotolerans]|uniref:Uncharacterized protein n=1 Tax=Zhihengliuella halotolerans TaxID=370736 RepID=A0A4Q8ABF6_9MICC|nr:hypothetical protein [Zhihengliuella halotolerans]RZU61438.1 hypothetical protein EV380_1008 [Zhihengliuella halotolerans]